MHILLLVIAFITDSFLAGGLIYDNPQATNVSFNQLSAEMANYTKPNYETIRAPCLQYAIHLHNYAESHGIKCGIVIVKRGFQDVEYHAINYFQTVDGYERYVDITFDCKIVTWNDILEHRNPSTKLISLEKYDFNPLSPVTLFYPIILEVP